MTIYAREMTGMGRFYIELANELSLLLEKLFADMCAKTSVPTHFIPLADVYCYWNRARGAGTVRCLICQAFG